MGRSLPVFLVRAAGMLVAGLLLFSLFGHARAQTNDNYGLNRFPGDNYDTIPPGAGMPPPPGPRSYAPVPGSSIGPNGTYSTLNGQAAAPQNYPGTAPQAYAPQSYPTYQAPPPSYQSSFQPVQAYHPAPAYQPPQQLAQQPTYQASSYQQPVASAAYGYKPEPGQAPYQAPVQAPAYQQPQPSYQPAPSSEAYGYKPLPAAQATYPVASNAATGRADPYAWYGQQGYGQRENADYVLGPGDKLRLIVFGETDLSGDFTIDGSGYARLPLVGQVRAAGYTAQQLEQVIGGALARGYLKSPRVSVEVATYRPFYVIGAVNRPGQYPYVEHMNAMNAVALAGGFTPTAVESVVFIRREGSNQEVEVPVDRTTVIHPGDVIKVHNTLFSDLTSWISPFSGVAASAATAAIIQ